MTLSFLFPQELEDTVSTGRGNPVYTSVTVYEPLWIRNPRGYLVKNEAEAKAAVAGFETKARETKKKEK